MSHTSLVRGLLLATLLVVPGGLLLTAPVARAAPVVAAAHVHGNFSGTWVGSDNFTYVFAQRGTEVTGRYDGTGPNAGRTGRLKGRVSGNTLTSRYITYDRGQPAAQGTFVLVREGNMLRGRWTATDGRQGEDLLRRGGAQATPPQQQQAATPESISQLPDLGYVPF